MLEVQLLVSTVELIKKAILGGAANQQIAQH